MRHAANECRVIDTVTAAPPPSDRERLATASPLPWGAIQLFDLRGLLTAPGRALKLRERGTNRPRASNRSQSRPGRALITHARLFWLVFLSIFRWKLGAEPTKVLFGDGSQVAL
jgi:hypothetical protein